MDVRMHLGWAHKLLSVQSNSNNSIFHNKRSVSSSFLLGKAIASSAWDSCFGSTKRIGREGWDLSRCSFSLGKLLLRYAGRTGTWDPSIVAVARAVVATVPGSDGLVGLEYRNFSYG